jgi:hypothetical protein
MMMTKKLQKKNKLVYGWGVNDADYVVYATLPNNRRSLCPYYSAWSKMLERVFDAKFHARRPTYIGASVCDEWKYFMNFRSWMMAQDWRDKQLDKDIIVPGNKHYSPETCAFVDQRINTLLLDRAAGRGKYPIGASYDKILKKYCAVMSMNGKSRNLGCFDTPEEASLVYRKEKSRYVRHIALTQVDDPRVRAGLLKHAILIMLGDSDRRAAA